MLTPAGATSVHSPTTPPLGSPLPMGMATPPQRRGAPPSAPPAPPLAAPPFAVPPPLSRAPPEAAPVPPAEDEPPLALAPPDAVLASFVSAAPPSDPLEQPS